MVARSFLCLNCSHSLKNCSKTHCSKCKRTHYDSIYSAGQLIFTSVHQIYAKSYNFPYLHTARVWIIGPTVLSKLTPYLLDAGSRFSFIRTSLVDDIQLEVLDERGVITTNFESTTPTPNSRRFVRFAFQRIWAKTNPSTTTFDSTHNTRHILPFPRI
jgi:hypothetical protein